MEDEKKIRLSKVSKEFNIGLSTIIRFLEKSGMIIEHSPNAHISNKEYNIIEQAFRKYRTTESPLETIHKKLAKPRINISITNLGNVGIEQRKTSQKKTINRVESDNSKSAISKELERVNEPFFSEGEPVLLGTVFPFGNGFIDKRGTFIYYLDTISKTTVQLNKKKTIIKLIQKHDFVLSPDDRKVISLLFGTKFSENIFTELNNPELKKSKKQRKRERERERERDSTSDFSVFIKKPRNIDEWKRYAAFRTHHYSRGTHACAICGNYGCGMYRIDFTEYFICSKCWNKIKVPSTTHKRWIEISTPM